MPHYRRLRPHNLAYGTALMPRCPRSPCFRPSRHRKHFPIRCCGESQYDLGRNTWRSRHRKLDSEILQRLEY